MKMNVEQIKTGLRNFYGTEQYHRVTIFGNLVATDGVAWLCKNAGCYWICDEIGLGQALPAFRNPDLKDFQVWKLTVKNSVGQLTLEDGNDNEIFTKQIPYTDFPLDEITIWVEGGRVMLLPSEH